MMEFNRLNKRDGLKERDELITEHLYLVRVIAVNLWRKLPISVELDELISAGNQGLVEAAAAFDRTADVTFSGFAKTRIHGAMIDHLRVADHLTRTSRTWEKRISRLEASLGRAVTDEELAAEFNCTVAKAREIRAFASVSLQSLDMPKSSSEKHPADPACPRPSPFDAVAAGELMDVMKRAVALLSPRFRYVLEMSYNCGVTSQQIAERMGISQGRVSQIRASALDKLRAILQGLGINGSEPHLTGRLQTQPAS